MPPTIIAYVDDAEHAQPFLQAAARSAAQPAAHWVLVACAPRITHRVSRFASNRSRENWRSKWADKLFKDCVPMLQDSAAELTTILARSPLPELLESLQAQYGTHVQVLDLRRPKLEQPPQVWMPQKLGGTLASMGALWTVLVGETLAA